MFYNGSLKLPLHFRKMVFLTKMGKLAKSSKKRCLLLINDQKRHLLRITIEVFGNSAILV